MLHKCLYKIKNPIITSCPLTRAEAELSVRVPAGDTLVCLCVKARLSLVGGWKQRSCKTRKEYATCKKFIQIYKFYSDGQA